MGWKIFFWVYLVLAVLSFLDVPKSPKPIDLLGYPFTLIEVIGFFGFAYKKNIFPQRHWKTIFWAYMAFFMTFILSTFAMLTNSFPILHSSRFEMIDDNQKLLALGITLALFILFTYIFRRLAYHKTD